MGNVVGISAAEGDVELLRFCLEELGHRAGEGRWMYIPVCVSLLSYARLNFLSRVMGG